MVQVSDMTLQELYDALGKAAVPYALMRRGFISVKIDAAALQLDVTS